MTKLNIFCNRKDFSLLFHYFCRNMTVKETISEITSTLSPLYGGGEASAMASVIMEYLKGYSKVDLIINSDKEVSDFIAGKVKAILERLLKHEPLQYVLGQTEWHGLRLKVTPAVLIPRPETSELVDIIADRNRDRSDLRVLDLCTGSGCIAIALARSLRFAQVTAADISAPALEVARENAASLRAKVDFRQADVTEARFGSGIFDIVVSNPPYVLDSERAEMDSDVKDYEPANALFVPDDDPLRFYRAVERIAAESLVAGGQLYFEINPLTAAALERFMIDTGWEDVTLLPDIHGRRRFLSAMKRS